MFLDFIKTRRVQQILSAIEELENCSSVKKSITSKIELSSGFNRDDLLRQNYENYIVQQKNANILVRCLNNSRVSSLLEDFNLESKEKNLKYSQLKLDEMHELIGIKNIKELLEDELELLSKYPNKRKAIEKIYLYYLKKTLEILNAKIIRNAYVYSSYSSEIDREIVKK